MRSALALAILFTALSARGDDAAREVIVVIGKDVVEDAAQAASEGVITSEELERRPIARPADVLESIPGVVVSQHSGAGKAHQYYLRGFNLDHGTDLAATVAGAPVNMPTHAHGQGYSDQNFLIPELIDHVRYRKGPYYAAGGDFSSAGAIEIDYVHLLERPIVMLTGGELGHRRALAAGSTRFGGGHVLAAIELSNDEGPWRRPDDYRKVSSLFRFTGGSEHTAWSITLSGYDGKWNATDQIPARAIGVSLSRFAGVDPSNGGASSRSSAVAEWQRNNDGTLTKATAYAIGYRLNLFSNFTYFLDDPVNGDQFEQEDRRVIAGGRTTREWSGSLFGRPVENLIGFDVRHDRIGAVGLYRTRRRERIDTIRADRVRQTSGGVFAETTVRWTNKLRTAFGLRGDVHHFRVDDGAAASLLSPKLRVILGPWRKTEWYVNAGTGFHSNDARGATDPLVRTRGAEIGVRTTAIPRLDSTLAVWGLDVASELVFAGDAGTTEASPASRRVGLEWSNRFRASKHIVLDADVALTRARFRGGDRIPGAVERVISSGISFAGAGPWSSSLHYRHLGPRPLIEDNSVRADASHMIHGEIGYAVTSSVRVVLEGLNLTDARASDAEYFYRSRLAGEPLDGIDGVHTHPVEPRAFRIRIETRF